MSESLQQLEERFLASVGKDPIPVDELIALIVGVAKGGNPKPAAGWAELLQDALNERGDTKDAARLLELRLEWPETAPEAVKAGCAAVAARILGKGKPAEHLLETLGYKPSHPPAECVARLVKLTRIEPGLICLNKTWGFGVVRALDPFYERVSIDFDRKKDHTLALSYALESLDLIGPDHLLALRHRDPARVRQMIESEQSELVKHAIRSFGPMNSARLQETLAAHGLVAEGAWKPFWDAARKGLKNDPLVDMPADRKTPITIREGGRRYDESWLQVLSRERDLEMILKRIDQAVADEPALKQDARFREVVANRLAYAVVGANSRQSGIWAEAVMSAHRLGLTDALPATSPQDQAMFTVKGFMDVAAGLSSRDLDEFMEYMIGRNREQTIKLLLDAFPDLSITVFNAAVEFLIEHGAQDEFVECLKGWINLRKETVEMLYWLARRPDYMEAKGLGRAGDLPFRILDAMRGNYAYERLKAANQLRELLQDGAWLEQATRRMSDFERREFMAQISRSSAIRGLDTQTVMAKLVRMYPELGSVVASKSDDEDQPLSGGLTSWRSYRARQKQLEHIVREEIPQNSRDIAQARSYGDLRENFEFKAAKEQQRLLMRRQEDLEADLKQVHGTDFAGFPTEVVGMGTSVKVRFADGHEEQYHVLGEWDQDPNLGILSCRSRMAEVLKGHRAGDAVEFPADMTGGRCTVVEVGGLPDHIRSWAAQE